MESYKTSQEHFWAEDFGSDYIQRNQSQRLFAANLKLFSEVLSYTNSVSTVLEFGANTGLNLSAIALIQPDIEVSALEINKKACEALEKKNFKNIYNESIFNFKVDEPRDLVVSKGFLIHLAPDYLDKAYDILYQSSKKYIFIGEYYNPKPVAIPYRGHDDKLYKRDFCGEILDRYNDLKLIKYGFCYHRDSNFPQDDITWFLLEKRT